MRVELCTKRAPLPRISRASTHAGGLTHGVMLMNSNGMEVVITSNTLQFRAVGGVLDFYFLLGPSPMDVLDQLTSIVGRPVMPPYWSLGLMQSKCALPDLPPLPLQTALPTTQDLIVPFMLFKGFAEFCPVSVTHYLQDSTARDLCMSSLLKLSERALCVLHHDHLRRVT